MLGNRASGRIVTVPAVSERGGMAAEFAPTMRPDAAVSRSALEDPSPHASPCRYHPDPDRF
ncbi:hypothetical protein [Methylobacterium sp. E-065]|uniref:hypothetical protein n=1 Tax=Methylobacterium sp. E-065 TaxID=2836583 RepID=UPI001FBB4682|nr:hypothetical protein [Methylobacterium sp. E-065]